MEKYIALFIEEKISDFHHLALKNRLDKEEIKRIYDNSGLSKEDFELISEMVQDSNDYLEIKNVFQDNGYDYTQSCEKANSFFHLIINLCEEYTLDSDLWYEAVEECGLILGIYIYDIYKMIM